jgi:hypothetical protein
MNITVIKQVRNLIFLWREIEIKHGLSNTLTHLLLITERTYTDSAQLGLVHAWFGNGRRRCWPRRATFSAFCATSDDGCVVERWLLILTLSSIASYRLTHMDRRARPKEGTENCGRCWLAVGEKVIRLKHSSFIWIESPARACVRMM